MKNLIKLPPEQPIDRSGGNFIINMQTLVHVKIQLCMILFRTKNRCFILAAIIYRYATYHLQTRLLVLQGLNHF